MGSVGERITLGAFFAGGEWGTGLLERDAASDEGDENDCGRGASVLAEGDETLTCLGGKKCWRAVAVAAAAAAAAGGNCCVSRRSFEGSFCGAKGRLGCWITKGAVVVGCFRTGCSLSSVSLLFFAGGSGDEGGDCVEKDVGAGGRGGAQRLLEEGRRGACSDIHCKGVVLCCVLWVSEWCVL